MSDKTRLIKLLLVFWCGIVFGKSNSKNIKYIGKIKFKSLTSCSSGKTFSECDDSFVKAKRKRK